MNKTKDKLTLKLLIVFFILLILTVVSFLLLDKKNLEDKGYYFGDNMDEFFINVHEGNRKVTIGKNGINIGTPHISIGEVEEGPKESKVYEYDIKDYKKISVDAVSVDCRIVQSDLNKMEIKAKGPKGKNLLDVKKGTDSLTIDAKDRGEVEIRIETPLASDFLLELSGSSVNLENNCNLKGLSISSMSTEFTSKTENSYDIEIDSMSIEADISVTNNNFVLSADGMSIGHNLPNESGNVTGSIEKRYGTGENKLNLEAMSVELNLVENK
ncbi:hypothetical protein [Lagierella sp.]|uniref:hypothetical protein n=1 Tax=Lagierella sp. TaxID=2849657 RepID=UPI00261EE82A|nr:hypothetical protein [Lagierella sp.]